MPVKEFKVVVIKMLTELGKRRTEWMNTVRTSTKRWKM